MGQLMTRDLSSRFNCLLITYILIVVSPNLLVHELIGLTCQAHHMGVAQEPLKKCTPTSHDSTRVALPDLPWGMSTTAPYNQLIGAGNNHQEKVIGGQQK